MVDGAVPPTAPPDHGAELPRGAEFGSAIIEIAIAGVTVRVGRGADAENHCSSDPRGEEGRVSGGMLIPPGLEEAEQEDPQPAPDGRMVICAADSRITPSSMRGQRNLHRPVPSQKISFTLSARFERKQKITPENGSAFNCACTRPIRVLVATKPVDFRKGMDGLAALQPVQALRHA
jgi:hypothetical protein